MFRLLNSHFANCWTKLIDREGRVGDDGAEVARRGRGRLEECHRAEHVGGALDEGRRGAEEQGEDGGVHVQRLEVHGFLAKQLRLSRQCRAALGQFTGPNGAPCWTRPMEVAGS